MNQMPCLATNPYMVQQQTTYMPVPQQPKLNAVNIEINNPTVGGQQGVGYAQPTMPYYNYPQAPVYSYPVAQQPVCYPPVAQQPQVIEAPQVEMPSISPVTQPAPMAAPVVTEAPVQQAPQVAQQINNNAPVVVETPKAPTAEVPAPVVSNPTPAVPVEVVEPQTVAPQVDLNSFIAKLTNPDFEAQSAGMEEIADMVKNAPEKATELVDTKVFDALTNIINFDSSKLDGPTQEQIAAREKIMSGKEVSEDEKALANKITPKEQAERNKSYALFTSAIMQKLYGDEVEKLTNSTVPLTELPGAVTIVDNLKDNPNPMVRASAIEALSYIQKPAYKKDLETVFSIAQNDSDAGVAEAAKDALKKLEQV